MSITAITRWVKMGGGVRVILRPSRSIGPWTRDLIKWSNRAMAINLLIRGRQLSHDGHRSIT